MDNEESKIGILKLGETEYKTFFTGKFLNRKKWKKPVFNRIMPPIPATITEILVVENQHVQKGDKLFVYEAMKMRNVIYASVSGKIKVVNVTIGQKVGKDFVLAELDVDFV